MTVLAAATWEYPVGFLEFLVGCMGIFFFRIETERWPGQYLQWTPYVSGSTDRYQGTSQVRVGVRRKGHSVRLTTLDPTVEDFDNELAAAESLARERCIQLNSALRSARRKLP